MRFIIVIIALSMSYISYSQTGWVGGPEDPWNGSNYSLNGQIYRAGPIEAAFVLQGGNTNSDPEWGGHWYGLSRGDKSKMYFNKVRSSSFRFPVALNGHYGIGFRTSDGNMAFLQNGILTIGLTDSKIIQLANNSSSNPYKLYVAGGIRSPQITTDSPSNWADFVFNDTYDLPPLKQVEEFILENNHLPGIPSAIEVTNTGVNAGEMDALLLQKIEELTLYVLKLEDKKQQLMLELSN